MYACVVPPFFINILRAWIAARSGLYIYIYTAIANYIYFYLYIYINIYLYIYIFTCIYMYVCPYLCVCVWTIMLLLCLCYWYRGETFACKHILVFSNVSKHLTGLYRTPYSLHLLPGCPYYISITVHAALRVRRWLLAWQRFRWQI
jgi:hypothetical protein